MSQENWIHMIAELRSIGISQQKIAEFCGCTQVSVSRYQLGKSTPEREIAKKLKKLHRTRYLRVKKRLEK